MGDATQSKIQIHNRATTALTDAESVESVEPDADTDTDVRVERRARVDAENDDSRDAGETRGDGDRARPSREGRVAGTNHEVAQTS